MRKQAHLDLAIDQLDVIELALFIKNGNHLSIVGEFAIKRQ